MKVTRRALRGFTLIELVVVISILAVLSGVVIPRVSSHQRAARDARRLADIKTLRNAVEQFHMDRGEYPVPKANSFKGHWEVSTDKHFLEVLHEEGYLDREFADPINDESFHYRYFVYESGAYGCQSEGPFFVLGIRNFESDRFAEGNRGFFKCGTRDWAVEFAYVVGGNSDASGSPGE